MPTFWVNKKAQSNGDYEVHSTDITRWCLPDLTNRIDLGSHPSCAGAVSAARAKGYRSANGCANCAPARHTS